MRKAAVNRAKAYHWRVFICPLRRKDRGGRRGLVSWTNQKIWICCLVAVLSLASARSKSLFNLFSVAGNFSHSLGAAWAWSDAGKSIWLKNIRDPKQVRLGFYGVHVQQSLKVEGMKVKVSDYSERRNEQRGSSFTARRPHLGRSAVNQGGWGSITNTLTLFWVLPVCLCASSFLYLRTDGFIQASDSW